MTQREEELESALADMCWQFGYRGTIKGKRELNTGGLSALEGAFDTLGWDDPYYPETSQGCSKPDCAEWATAGGPHETGYYFTCSRHSDYVPELADKDVKKTPDA